MAIRDKLLQLAKENINPSVTISLNTHRTHPDSDKDSILLKNLLKEAEARLYENFDKKEIEELLKKMSSVMDEIDFRHNLDSLHIFLSNKTKEIIKSSWSTYEDRVRISGSFDIRPLVKAYNRSEEFLILLLSQGGANLYNAQDNNIISEIKNEDFPFDENPYYTTDNIKKSNAKLMDNLVREFYNQIDKAVVKVSLQTGLRCIVICIEENYSYLMQVADKPEIYLGFSPIDYNKTEKHQIAKQAWELIKEIQENNRALAIEEMKEAMSANKVITDLQDIYQAAIDGRGDLLIVYEDFTQPVIMNEDGRTFSVTDDMNAPNVIDDITSTIVWEVISRNGRAIFTKQDEIKEFGDIVLKARY